MTANPLPPIPPISATTGMVPAAGASRFKPIDPLKVTRQYLHWLIAAGVAGLILGVGAYFLLNLTMPRWTSLAQLEANAPLQDPMATGQSLGQGNMDWMEAFMQNEVIRITSEHILREALDNPIVRDTSWFKQFASLQEAQEALKEDYLSVYPVRGSTLITLAVHTPTEEDAPKILQSIINVYMRVMAQEMQQRLSGASGAFVQERARTEAEINQLQQQLRLFTEQNDITSLDARYSEANIIYQQLATEQNKLRFALEQYRQILVGLEQKIASGDTSANADTLARIEMMPELQQVNGVIHQLDNEVQASAAQYGENHRTTQYLRHKLEAARANKQKLIERKVREQNQADLETTRTQIATLDGQINAMNPKLQEAAARMTDLTAKLAEYEQMQERLTLAREKLAGLEVRQTELRVAGQRDDAISIRPHVSPTLPEKTFPKWYIVIPGVAFLTLGATAGLIFLRELTDQRIKSPTDVKLLPDVDLLGVLPHADEDPSAPTGVERVVEKYPTGLMAESFRQVRTALLAKMDRRGYKTLMIVGGQPGAGTSTIAQNLATSLAYNGRNVLLIDANLRRPGQHRLVGMSNQTGLIDILQGRAELDDAIVPLEGLSVSILPTGHAEDAPPELLESPACRSLLSQLESRYDVVIVDAPPALLASESQLLAKHVDALALVVRANTDHRGMVERMLRRLDGHRADILGVILNGVRSAAGGYFRKNYRDFYRYRQGSGLEDARGGTGGNGRAVKALTNGSVTDKS